jgi:peroxiredoxin Q/BCP
MAAKKKKARATKKPGKKKAATKKKAAPKAAPKKQAAPKKKAASNKAAPKSAAPTKAAPAASASPAAGTSAPAFSLPGDDGKTHALADHKGQPVVVYFYPRDDTPGCTVEACGFRDNMARATAKGAVVYGISKDSLKSHERFRAKFNLNFTLLSDEGLDVHRAYGAWGEKLLYGKPTVGVIRSTFLIDKNGVVARAWPRVKVDGHVDDVLAALDRLT